MAWHLSCCKFFSPPILAVVASGSLLGTYTSRCLLDHWYTAVLEVAFCQPQTKSGASKQSSCVLPEDVSLVSVMWCVQEPAAVTLPQVCCLCWPHWAAPGALWKAALGWGFVLSCQALGDDPRHWPRCCSQCCLLVLLETENANSLARYSDKRPCVVLTVGQ